MILRRPYPHWTKGLASPGKSIRLFPSHAAALLFFSISEDRSELPADLRVSSVLLSPSKLAQGYNWCTMLAIEPFNISNELTKRDTKANSRS
jgi:hypothetical protein